MEMYTQGNSLKLSVTNIDEFNELLRDAKKQICELQETIHRLQCFNIDFEFSIQPK